MNQERRGNSNLLHIPFIFVRRGDPKPTDWMAEHPDWIKFSATLVPRGASSESVGLSFAAHTQTSSTDKSPIPQEAVLFSTPTTVRRQTVSFHEDTDSHSDSALPRIVIANSIAPLASTHAAGNRINPKARSAKSLRRAKPDPISKEELADARERAFLRLVRWGENGSVTDYEAYRARFGGKDPMTDKEMQNYEPKKEPFLHNGIPETATAAGAYGITGRTWALAAGQLGLRNFDPASQDAAAKWLINYHDATDAVRNGQLKDVFKKLHNEWSSLPGGSQSHHNFAQAYSQYSLFLKEELRLASQPKAAP